MKSPGLTKIIVIALSAIMTFSSCAPTPQQTKNHKKQSYQDDAAITTDDEDVFPEPEQEFVSTTEKYQVLDEEKSAQYENQTQIIRNGEISMRVGFTKLKNVKSAYNRDKNELEVSGIAEVLTDNKKSVKSRKEFKISGKYKGKTGTINLRPSTKDSEGLQVRAVVTCSKNEALAKYDCSRAIVDIFIKDGDNYYTEQLESTSFAKPVIIEREKKKEQPVVSEKPAEKPKVEVEVEVTENNEDEGNQVKETEELDKEKLKQEAEKALEQAIAEEDATNHEEGDDGSIDGRYEGQAGQVKLTEIFNHEADDAVKTEEEEKAQPPEIPVRQDRKGRLILTNQADGSPEAGRLRNASFLKTHIDSYDLADKIVIANSSTKNCYGTQEMMDILEAIGEKMASMQKNRIYVSRISAKRGGPLPPSKSHQIGMDADLGYPTHSGQKAFPVVASGGSLRNSDYSPEKTLELFKFLMTQSVTPVDRIFADQSIINNLCREAKNSGKLSGADRNSYLRVFQNIQHVDGHGDHFHLRIRCVPNQPDCRHKIYKKMNNCG